MNAFVFVKKCILKTLSLTNILTLFGPTFLKRANSELRSMFYRIKSKKTYTLKHLNSIDTILLGSSHMEYAFNVNNSFKNISNLASNSQDLETSFQLYSYWCEQIPNLKTVVLGISTFSIGYQLYKTKRNFLTDIIVYLYGFNFEGYEHDDNNLLACEYYDKREKKVNISPPPIVGDETTVQDRVKGHIRENEREPNQMDSLKKIVSLSEKHKHNLYFVLMPATSEYKRLFPEEEIVFRKLFDVVKKNNTLINFYGFNGFNDSEDYYDFDHLNKQGSEKFSKMLLEKLQ